MKKYKFIFSIAFILALAGIVPASAQWVNKGADVFIASNAQVMVNASYIHEAGNVQLNGWLGLSGNWENNDATTAGLNQDGLGTVELLGADQNIGGTSPSIFYNLRLSGTGIKTMDIHQQVSHELDLTDRELALRDFNLDITSTDVNAIVRSSGFISSVSTDALITRKTALSGGEYLFPTGSGQGTARYRPVILTVPADAASGYGVSYSNTDPNTNGLSRQDNLGAGITDVNSNFYHHVKRTDNSATAFDMSLLYADADGGFKEMAYWDNTGWKNLNKTALTNADYGDGLTSRITKSGVDLLSGQYFALANGTLGANFLGIPTAFSPNGDGMNDVFMINGIENYPDNEVRILNRWGDELFYRKAYNNSSNAFNGGDLDAGTYYYAIKVNLNGEMKSFSGYLTLLR